MQRAKEHSTLSPKGWLTDFDDGVTRETLQCCHCSCHFVVSPGSGRQRGYCTRCGDVTCGKPECDDCLPFEQWLDNVEAGRPEKFRQVLVPVSVDLNAGN